MSTTTTTTTTTTAPHMWSWEELGNLQASSPNRFVPINDNVILAQLAELEIERTIDGGQTWSEVIDLKDETPTSLLGGALIKIPGTEDLLLGGGFNISCWKSIDKGTTWYNVYSDAGVGPYDIHALNNMIVLFSDSAGYIVRSTDGGETWAPKYASEPYGILEDLGSGRVLGGKLSGSTGIDRSTDWGLTWTEVLSAAVVTNIVTPSSGYALAVDSDTEVWQSTDFGANWTNIATITDFGAPENPRVHTLSAINNDVAIIALNGASDREIWGTEDGGYTWEFIASPADLDPALDGESFSGLEYLGNNQFIVGILNGVRVFKLTRHIALPEIREGSSGPPSASPLGVVNEGFGGFGFGGLG